MALVNILLRGEEYSLDIGDDVAILFLKKLGVFDDNLRYKSEKAPEVVKTTEVDNRKSKKSSGRLSLQEKAEMYGINKLKREYENGEKSVEYFLNHFGIKESTFRKLLHDNGIKKQSKQKIINTVKEKDTAVNNKAKTTKVSASSVVVFKQQASSKPKRRIGGINSTLKVERPSLERTVKIENGTCLRCAYKDKVDGACDYSLITLNDRRGSKGMCDHFIDLEDLK